MIFFHRTVADYDHFVELGNIFIEPDPYIRTSFNGNFDGLVADIGHYQGNRSVCSIQGKTAIFPAQRSGRSRLRFYEKK